MAKKEQPKRDLAFVQRLENRYVQCRSLRHAWNLIYFGAVRTAPEEINTMYSGETVVRQSKCLRCDCIKEDFYNTQRAAELSVEHPAFRAFYSRYRHPQGYLWSSDNGVDRPKFYDFTEELYQRFQTNQLRKD